MNAIIISIVTVIISMFSFVNADATEVTKVALVDNEYDISVGDMLAYQGNRFLGKVNQMVMVDDKTVEVTRTDNKIIEANYELRAIVVGDEGNMIITPDKVLGVFVYTTDGVTFNPVPFK
jgi:hypothetical protein